MTCGAVFDADVSIKYILTNCLLSVSVYYLVCSFILVCYSYVFQGSVRGDRGSLRKMSKSWGSYMEEDEKEKSKGS